MENRVQAGQDLAVKLGNYQGVENLIVLAIPRGRVVVGKELAKLLHCSLDVIVTKKIGASHNPELAIGAVGGFGEPVFNKELASQGGVDDQYLSSQISKLKSAIKRREQMFRKAKPALLLKNKAVILTDDGVATGATMMAAIKLIRQQNPKKIIVAVPVIAKDTLQKIAQLSDEVVYLQAPELFFSVGQFYNEFEQVSDDEVIKLLKQ